MCHIGHSLDTKYSMNVHRKVWHLEETKEERDLGIIVTSNLKASQQCVKAASKARSILGWINRHFGSLNADEFKILYKTYVRPHMEFCIQAWSPRMVFKQQLSKIDNSLLNTTHSACNLGFIFDEHLTFSDQISSLSKS